MRTVTARVGAIRALGRQLKRDGIEIVTLESTSDYWWLARLTEMGLLRASFVPPKAIGTCGTAPAPGPG